MNEQNNFHPPFFLRNSHLQTILPALRKTPKLKRTKEVFFTKDNDFVEVDFYGPQDAPLIFLIHGLGGNSNSSYILGMQKALYDFGFQTAAFNLRGASDTPNRRARSYHTGDIEDFDFVFKTLQERSPQLKMGIVGYSLGANLLLKWLAVQPDKSILGAVAISAPMKLQYASQKLNKGFSKLYRDYLLYSLKLNIIKKKAHLYKNKFTDEYLKLENINLFKIKSFYDYDNIVTAPLNGFKSAQDYYDSESSFLLLKNIVAPTLIIHAYDDPFMTTDVIPTDNDISATTKLELYPFGGHVGFFNPKEKNPYWLENRIPQFFKEKI